MSKKRKHKRPVIAPKFAQSSIGRGQSPSPPPPPKPPSPPIPPTVGQKKRWNIKTWIEVLSLVGLCLGIAAGVDQLWGKFWPTDPVVLPHDSASETSLILPFSVENDSIIFAMDDVHFTCGVDLVWAKDTIGSPIIARDQAFLIGSATIEPNQTIPVDCDATDLLTVNADGVLSFDGSSTILDHQHPWFPPWTIVKMCLWLGGTYKIAGIIPASFKSEIFQWPAAPGSGAWADGAVVQIARKNQTISGFLSGSTDCSPRIQYPYGLVEGPGQELLVFK